MPLKLGVSLEESRMETGRCQQRGETQVERINPDADGVKRPARSTLLAACCPRAIYFRPPSTQRRNMATRSLGDALSQRIE